MTKTQYLIHSSELRMQMVSLFYMWHCFTMCSLPCSILRMLPVITKENIVLLPRPKENRGAPKMTWGEIVIYRSSDVAFNMLLLLFILLSNRYWTWREVLFQILTHQTSPVNSMLHMTGFISYSHVRFLLFILWDHIVHHLSYVHKRKKESKVRSYGTPQCYTSRV